MVELSDDEIYLLRCGLLEWQGPARCTEQMAVAMGFSSVEELFAESLRLRQALSDRRSLPQRDWVRILLATEVVFASDVLGSGRDWHITTGIPDTDTITRLREIQRKIPTAGSLDVILWTRRPK